MRLLIVLIAPLLLGWGAVSQLGGTVPAAGGSTGTDFTADSRFIGCWLMGTVTDGETEMEADQCTTDVSDNMTYQGSTFVTAANVPDGTVSTVAADFDGVGDYLTVPDATKWESLDVTVGCWAKKDLDSFLIAMSKNQAENVALRNSADDINDNMIDGARETAATAITLGTWGWNGLRYDQATDEVEAFTDGFKDCSGGCIAKVDPANFAGAADLTLAASDTGNLEWDGQLHECFYANAALTDTEICEIMLCGLDGQANSSARSSAYGTVGCDCDDITTCC